MTYNTDVPTVEEIKNEIREDVEYIQTGQWIICSLETEEHTLAREAHDDFGKEGALEKVAKSIKKQKRREATDERRRQLMEEQRKRCKEREENILFK